MATLLGQTIGPYVIEREIGSGAMGIVYLATDERTRQHVAIKILRPWIARIERNVERFRQEAEAGLRIRHPSIVQTLEIGHSGEHYYIVMEYVNGASLQRLMRKSGQLPTKLALDLTRQLASALQSAHDVGVLHRDIKPQNIMVSESGVAKIMDFSLAKVLDSGAALTAAGTLVGTPMFMAPEQALGMKVDARCDIYSLGFMLYLMLAGVYPYKAEGQMELLEKVIMEPLPPITNYRPSLHKYVIRVLNRAIAKERDERYETAAEFEHDLLILLGQAPARAMPAQTASA